jgi:hypothetical protein
MCGKPDRSNTNSQDYSQRRCQQTSLANPTPLLLLFVHLFLFLFLALTTFRFHSAEAKTGLRKIASLSFKAEGSASRYPRPCCSFASLSTSLSAFMTVSTAATCALTRASIGKGFGVSVV